jgi:toxin ParE1/3/4
MTVVWSRRAVDHLIHLRRHIAQDSPAAAASVAQRILDCVALVSEHPAIGRPGRVAGTRELVVPQTPYIIPYRVRGNTLAIIAVFHQRQRWPDSL